jgi:hypothetical protein
MTKYLIAASVAAMFVVSPAFAAGKLRCNKAAMHGVEMMIKDAMAHPEMKKQEEMAMKESEMAMKAKEAGDIKGCRMHLNMAQESLMKHG